MTRKLIDMMYDANANYRKAWMESAESRSQRPEVVQERGDRDGLLASMRAAFPECQGYMEAAVFTPGLGRMTAEDEQHVRECLDAIVKAGKQ